MMSRSLAPLLRWAIRYIERENETLRECHSVPGTGEIRPARVKREIELTERWLAKAKQAVDDHELEVETSVCIGCGCDELNACDGGCVWLRLDPVDHVGVCSECPRHVKRFDRGDRKLTRRALREVKLREELGS